MNVPFLILVFKEPIISNSTIESLNHFIVALYLKAKKLAELNAFATQFFVMDLITNTYLKFMKNISVTPYLSLISRYRTPLMGFAILWVVFFHLPYELSSGVPSFVKSIKSIGYGGVDIFLFLSGFGLYYSLSKNDFNLREYYRSRFTRILPEFWVVLLLFFISNMDFSPRSFYNLICKATTLGYWVRGYGIPFTLWYISSIIGFYAVYPFFFKKFKEYGISMAIKSIIAALALIMIYALIAVYVFDNRNFGGLLILTISRIPVFIIGTIFGYATKNNINFTLSPIKIVLILFSVVIAALSLPIFFIFFKDYLWTCSLYFLPFIILTPALCVIICIIISKKKFLSSMLVPFGTISLELYLFHEYFFEKLFGYLSTSFNQIIASLLLVGLSIVCACILYFINNKYLTRWFNRVW
ncbi:acyltransferase [Bacteroidales bacterium OttesenSCG-928-J19]|nr:acyltransferase [Bacteroidales bacterium OttesenSCG-928-J19]